MKEFHHSDEFSKPPVDYSAPPSEISQLPTEYVMPEENPKPKAKPAAKKKSRTRQLLAMCLTGFVTLQVLFTYFVPQTDDHNQGGSSNQGSGGFQIHAMADHVDDADLKAGLQVSGEYFVNLDYTRASLKMLDAVCEFAMDQNPASLDNVAYGFHNSSIEDYDGSEVNGCYFYFNYSTVQYPDKDGEFVVYDALFAYIVSFEKRENGTYYRVIDVVYALSNIETYGMSYDWNANVYYYEGEVDIEGNSSDCRFVGYDATNCGVYQNVDGRYDVAAFWWCRGPVGDLAFLNGTQVSSWVTFDDSVRDFVLEEEMLDRIFYVNWLTEDGKLDLTHPAVMDATSGVNDAIASEFRNDDALDVLACPDYYVLKSTVDRQNIVYHYGQYLDRIMFSFDIAIAINIQNAIRWQSEQNKPGEEVYPEEEFDTNLHLKDLDDHVNLDAMQEILGQACDTLLHGDYVYASMLAADAVQAYADRHSAEYLYNTAMVWKDGVFETFDGQDLRDGSGVYIYFYLTDEKYVGKESDDIYSHPYLNMTLLVSQKQGSNDFVRTLNVNTEYFTMMSNIYSCRAKYLETTFDSAYRAKNVEMYEMYINTSYSSDENTVGQRVFGTSYLKGDLKQDVFYGDVNVIEYGAVMNDDQTGFVPDPYNPGVRILLDKNGRLDIQGMGLLHHREVDGQDYWDMLEVYANDDSLPGYVYSYKQYGILVVEHPEDSKLDYWREFVETDPLFTTGLSIEFWRMMQQNIK